VYLTKKLNSTHIHHFLRATILLGFAIYISILLISGDILQYIVPNLVLYIKITNVFLFFTAAFQFYIAVLSLNKDIVLCDCGFEHDGDYVHDEDYLEQQSFSIFKKSKLKDAFVYSLFILPLFLAFLPSQSLSSSMVEKRGMNLGGLASQNNDRGPSLALEGDEDPELRQLFKTNLYEQDYAKLGMVLYKQDQIIMEDEWFIEKLQAMNSFVDNFQDKPIEIKGFIYRDQQLSANQFIIARMGMTHCIADISPFGVIAEAVNANQFTDDSWVTITGRINKTEFNGLTLIKIDVISAESAEEPKVPYVYPDWDFASKL
jgi:putative membrane protein